MSDEQRNAIIKVNALLCKRFSLQPNANTIVYHHWYDLNTGERTGPELQSLAQELISSVETKFLMRKPVSSL